MLRVNRTRSRRSLISLTPLIDVVFILLVFFMLASSFMEWRAIDLGESGPAAEAASPDAALLLLVRADGAVVLDGQEVSAGALPGRLADLASTKADQRLAVQPEEGVSLQRVVDILEVANGSGLGAVSLVRPAGD